MVLLDHSSKNLYFSGRSCLINAPPAHKVLSWHGTAPPYSRPAAGSCKRASNHKEKKNVTTKPDSYPWTEFPGDLPSTFALPDFNSVYFSYGFDWIKNKTLGLRITGDFGYARYMSYNIYGELAGT